MKNVHEVMAKYFYIFKVREDKNLLTSYDKTSPCVIVLTIVPRLKELDKSYWDIHSNNNKFWWLRKDNRDSPLCSSKNDYLNELSFESSFIDFYFNVFSLVYLSTSSVVLLSNYVHAIIFSH